ncbi:MAG: hypothetical protein M3Z66_02025 [Chloroflexota bacterium]|nr:hypothetical protein [Chloroflexota bacterium]
MEVCDLSPGEFGVTVAGIYVVNEDGDRVLAGPFGAEADALAWIDRTLAAQGAAADRSGQTR